MIKLASWNVNSLKVRLEAVLNWLQLMDIDILALQETKLIDENFPAQVFEQHNYHLSYSGQKTYNGVAIISRLPLMDTLKDIPNLIDPQRRILVSTIGDLRLINLYVPNGAMVNSDKYSYKMEWLQKVTDFIQEQMRLYSKVAVVGDFNIAPMDADVHNPAAWVGSVMVSPLERAAHQRILAQGLYDSFRLFEQKENQFSWWDYRGGNFRRNCGLRIDHILVSESLREKCQGSFIDVAPRKLERPSDHAPIWVELDGAI